MPHATISRRSALALAALLATGAASARSPLPAEDWAHRRLGHDMRAPLRLAIVDRDTGRELQQYHHRGQVYVAGRPGARYSIRLMSDRYERLLAVVSVDGVNVITGKTAALTDGGYVLYPRAQQDITGWRKSDHEVAAFEFAAIRDSYAARTGRPDNVGVIGVAVFQEVPPPPPPMPGAFAAPSAPAAARMEKAAPAGGAGLHAQDSLGTGHGARETSTVTRTTFERASQHPAQVLAVRYDTYENLVAAGVIPKRRPAPQGPNPFPRSEPGYVPDPPPRW